MAPPTNRLFIKGLPSWTEKEDLLKVFNKHDGFVELFLADPNKRRQDKQIAFIEFLSINHAQRAKHRLGTFPLNKMTFDIDFALPMASPMHSLPIYAIEHGGTWNSENIRAFFV